MATFLSVDDPNWISGVGALLESMADDVTTRSRAILRLKETIERERPWGNDKYGQAFAATYYATPKCSAGRTVDAVGSGLATGGEPLAELGQGTVISMADFQGTDQQSAADIRRALA